MAWQDRLASWADAQLQRFPGIDAWLERHFHAMGLHGPEVRHLLRARFVPAATMLCAALVVIVAVALVRRGRRAAAGTS